MSKPFNLDPDFVLAGDKFLLANGDVVERKDREPVVRGHQRGVYIAGRFYDDKGVYSMATEVGDAYNIVGRYPVEAPAKKPPTRKVTVVDKLVYYNGYHVGRLRRMNGEVMKYSILVVFTAEMSVFLGTVVTSYSSEGSMKSALKRRIEGATDTATAVISKLHWER